MNNFYTNVLQRGNKIYVRGYENGKKYQRVENYKPYLFIPKQGGKYSTIDGKDVEKIDFESISDAKEFIAKYKDVSNFDVYGFNNFAYTYIYDNFPGEISFDSSLVSTVSIDIECAADEGFPSISAADKEITAITLHKNGLSYVFGCGDFTTKDNSIYYVKCKNEQELLHKFLSAWEMLDVDIVTGWNIEFFDIPYLVNRIKNQIGESEAKRLSPYKFIYEKEITFKGKTNQTYDIPGISILDYYQVYRKFSFKEQESFKLDFIASIELNEKKLDYSEYGSLLKLYKENYQKFIEYNIKDAILVQKLDEKLKFFEQIMTVAYDAKVNLNDTMATVKPWDVIIHNYLLDSRRVVPMKNTNVSTKRIAGGYVKEPRLGLSKWVVSFDLDSLYPHLIMSYNISPDTFEGMLEDFYSVDELLEGKINFSKHQTTADVAVAANGCMYTHEKQGFLAALMEKMYEDRLLYKDKMSAAKKELQLIEKELEKRGISYK